MWYPERNTIGKGASMMDVAKKHIQYTAFTAI